MITTRPVTPDDSEAWLRLRMEVYDDEDREGNLEEMASWRTDPNRAVFVAVDTSDSVVGLLEMSLRNIVDGCVTSPVGYIEGIIVDSSQRGEGIGRLLFERAKAWSFEKGCRQMGTDALLANSKAHQFHEKMGFEEVDRVIAYKMDL